MTIRVGDTDEQAGLGAAIAASVGAGVYKNIDEGVKAVVKYKDFEIIPNPENHKRYMEYYQLYKDIFGGCHDALHRVTLLGRKN